MRMKRFVRSLVLIGLSAPVLGLVGCLPSLGEISDAAANSLQGFVNGIITDAINNAFAGFGAYRKSSFNPRRVTQRADRHWRAA